MTSPTTIRWVVNLRDKQFETGAARALGIHPLVATVLRNRGLDDYQAIAEFLDPSVDRLHDPFLLPDMEAAVRRSLAALRSGQSILVHGDYDVDGITATALLCRFLDRLGADVSYFIPHRIRDTYGLNAEVLAQAAAEGISLVIAVDCGITDHLAIRAATERGIDVIVIDHHEPGPQLPQATAVVNAKRRDAVYPEHDLAAVGLAFKFASALCQRLGIRQQAVQRAYLDLVALGTIADVVPLTGENRILARTGLELLSRTRKVGLQALMRICSLDGALRASDVSFRLAPRLNAVGRMGDASDGLELLLTTDEEEAQRLALHLDTVNRDRQREQDSVLSEAVRQVEEELDLERTPVIVMASEGWHVGVLGIVAAKLVERYGRPAVLLTSEEGIARGSARSIAGFDISAAFEECSDLLLRHGGHAMAAGLALEVANLQQFRECLNALARRWLRPDQCVPQLPIDAEVRLFEIDGELVEDLARLEPFGHGNPQPRFMSRRVEIIECRRVGRNEQHLKLYACQDDQPMECIGFGMGPDYPWIRPGSLVDICYTPEFNYYNGHVGLQLCLEAIRPARGTLRG